MLNVFCLPPNPTPNLIHYPPCSTSQSERNLRTASLTSYLLASIYYPGSLNTEPRHIGKCFHLAIKGQSRFLETLPLQLYFWPSPFRLCPPLASSPGLSVVVCVCLCVCVPSRVQLFATPRTVACQAPLSVEFLRQEYWNGLLFPPLGELPDPGIKPMPPTLADGFFTSWATLGSPGSGDNFLLLLNWHLPHLLPIPLALLTTLQVFSSWTSEWTICFSAGTLMEMLLHVQYLTFWKIVDTP